MEVQFFAVYSAYGGGDDRRSPDELLGWFSDKPAADIAADRQGWYGGPGLVTSNTAVRIEGKVYVLGNAGQPIDLDGTAAKTKQRLREAALSKLTAAEIEALGVKT